jgi:hypothetical protein
VADGSSLSQRLLQSPRVGFALTTAALVVLASGGTALLVSHGTSQLQPAAPRSFPPRSASPAAGPVLVERAPGSFAPPQVHAIVPAAAPALLAAPPRSSISVQLLPPVPVPVPVPPSAPASVPPALEPQAVAPPPVVALPPVVEPPVLDRHTKAAHKKPHPSHPDDHGKHLGQHKH